mmetsp:Transcript_21374/g.27633  ORF Transcript_21374/g.27633 Transcript_21374/m.27633 type:complete len:82 (-) Transcript_21374:58-303(-)
MVVAFFLAFCYEQSLSKKKTNFILQAYHCLARTAHSFIESINHHWSVPATGWGIMLQNILTRQIGWETVVFIHHLFSFPFH